MLKPKIKLLLVLALSCPLMCLAQQDPLYKYIRDVLPVNYTTSISYTDERYNWGRPSPDTLNVEVSKPEELQKLIDAKLNLKTYGVCLKADSATIGPMVSLLKQFPHVDFIKFNDASFFARDKKSFLLPPSIADVPHLNGVEFNLTFIDIRDALSKLASVKGLRLISYTGGLPIGPELLALKDLRIVKLSSRVLKAMDVSQTHWETVDFLGDAPNIGTDEAALQKLAELRSLKTLTISFCELGDDISVLSRFTQLEKLNISSTQFKPSVRLFEQIGKLKNLSALSVRLEYRDSIQTMKGLAELSALEYLSLEGFKTTPVVPGEISQLKHLKKLILQGNPFTTVPLDILNMPQLEYLDLSSNKLTSLPEVGKYRAGKLKTLKLTYNAIAVLPNAITSLSSLEVLDAQSNTMTLIPANGWERLQHLKMLNLGSNRITVFPGGTEQITGLEKLLLNNNQIASIPDLTGNNYQLKQLDLNSNDLTELPTHVGKFIRLEMLNVAGNRLIGLPESLGDCIHLKELNAATNLRTSIYDATKPERQRYTLKIDSSKVNNIRSLPTGLKNTPDLNLLNLEGNPAINETSVFDVILAIPRKNFHVRLSGDNIRAIPASKQWADMTFDELDLSNNKLTTLPVEFAYMKKFGNLSISKNHLSADQSIGAQQISTKANLKIVYDELGIDLPGYDIPNSAYATALAQRIMSFFGRDNWAKAVAYANKARALDSTAYNTTVPWEEIGICRYELKDYKGAISDFDHFIDKEAKTFMHWSASLTSTESYKAKAHLALGQAEKAAETHEYFGKKYNNMSALQEAAIIYKQIGREEKYHQLLDTALLNYQLTLDSYTKQKHQDVSFILDYAELLIIADKAADATNLLMAQDPKLFTKQYIAIKAYLIASANYLKTPMLYPQIKTSLIADIATNGKVTGWDFDMFNNWVTHSGMDSLKQQQLMALQEVVK